jgi:ATP-dependent protease Clp ATPase subunit
LKPIEEWLVATAHFTSGRPHPRANRIVVDTGQVLHIEAGLNTGLRVVVGSDGGFNRKRRQAKGLLELAQIVRRIVLTKE